MSATKNSLSPSAIRKRSVVIGAHKTSVSLEKEFWESLCEIAATHGKTTGELVGEIKAAQGGNLSSAVRIFVLTYFRDRQLESSDVAA